MTDVLIRDVPEDDLRALDARAATMGLSRNEFLRRQLHQEAQLGKAGQRKVTREDLRRAAEICRDVLDPDFERRAWSCSSDE